MTDPQTYMSIFVDLQRRVNAEYRREKVKKSSKRVNLRDRMVSEYKSGVPVRKIASGCGVTRQTVYNVLRDRGVDLRGQKKVSVSESEICSAYEGGASLRSLASKHDIGVTTVRNILIRNGVELRRRGGSQ